MQLGERDDPDQHGDRKGPPHPTLPPSPLLYTGFATPTSYSSGGACPRHALSAIFPFTAVMFHIIGAIAELERDVISERTQAGLTR